MKHTYKNDKIIKQMGKTLNNLYLFSKLTTTLVLFTIIIFMSYIFYKAYKSQNLSQSDLDNKLSMVFDSINHNSQNLKILKNKADSTELALNQLINSPNQSEQNIDQQKIDHLINENKILKNQISELTKKLSSIGNSLNNNKNNELKDLLEIINLKFNNGSNILKDIMVLQKINDNINNESVIEKLLLLSENNFIGIESLNINFDSSVKDYLNYKYLKNNKNIIIRFLSEYVDIKPNKISYFDNPTLQILFQAKTQVQNNNIENSLATILTLSDAKNFFQIWIQQARIYIEFRNTLKQITINNV